ncbi:MAG: succinate dehydrogenase assembly factor 2 [Alphaproteobacteria bacterium]|nr:succinate dehydrogenase assembly factor 2 [Alphaproteobacteria bacterium]
MTGNETRAPVNDNPSSNAHEIRVKRLRFRAWHRGIREMDILIGGFADAHLADMSKTELDAFELLLSVPDQEMYAILTRDAAPWPELDATLIERLRGFIRDRAG